MVVAQMMNGRMSFLCFVYRMLGRRDEESSAAMIDVAYTQNRSDRKVVVVLQNLYLCASVEFLLAVADFFIQAMPQTKVDKANQLQVKQLSDARGAAQTPSGKQTAEFMQVNSYRFLYNDVVSPQIVTVVLFFKCLPEAQPPAGSTSSCVPTCCSGGSPH